MGKPLWKKYGEETLGLDALVVNLYHHTMTTMINVLYGNLTGEAEPLAKKRKTMDSGLILGGRTKTAGAAMPSPPMALRTTPTPSSTQSGPKRRRPNLS